ncbi:MAG: thioredoxin [Proteobacteria bacterium]|nr:thioredoxin [Pseudomonadota bacterium]
MDPTQDAAAPRAGGELIKDSDTKNFETDVIAAPMEVPVIVDFWAPWCGPCKQLGPAIEKAVTAAGGKVRLVKIDIDKNPEIAQAMRVQSIPAVFAFVKGQPVDGFVGAQTDSQIKAFIQKLGGANGPSPVEQAFDQAKAALENQDHDAAAAIFGQILEHEADNPEAIAGLTRCLIAADDFAAAHEVLSRAGAAQADHAGIASARTALDLAEQGAGSRGEIDGLKARVEADADDHQARYDLAVAMFGTGQQEAAIEHLLEIMGRDRGWNDDGARKQLLVFFEAIGFADPLAVEARKKMSSMMFS